MSFKILTTSQYDNTLYEPLGTAIAVNVETISLFRNIIGSFTGMFGGTNGAATEGMRKMQDRLIRSFRSEVSKNYPNTTLVIGLDTDITQMSSGNNQNTYVVMKMIGTCLGNKQSATVPAKPPSSNSTNENPVGGGRRNTRKSRRR